MVKSDNLVYVCMAVDFVHPGHINILKEARKRGKVMVGLLTDRAIASYKDLPVLDYEDRKIILENLKLVDEIVPQHTLDYSQNLLNYKPRYVIHGDDWKKGPQSPIRKKVLDTLKQWNGEVVDVPYTTRISSHSISKSIIQTGSTPDIRRSRLKRLIEANKKLRFLEVHSGLSGLIVEHTVIEKNGERLFFDGMWASSLTDSTLRAKPDIEVVDYTSRLKTIDDIFDVTSKPLIFDGDTGGKIEHFIFSVKWLERIGVSAVIIEDKVGLKKNSLLGNDVFQQQDSIEGFCKKIEAGVNALQTDEFYIIARIESLILEKGLDDALTRAIKYVEAGASGIMIHSRKKSPREILEFCKLFTQENIGVPLIAVPSSYNTVYEEELWDAGVQIIIYANHLLRSSYPAMQKTAISILQNKRSVEADKDIMSINEILKLIPGTS